MRALPVWSDRLGLIGKCDIVEVETGTAHASRAAEGASPSDSLHPAGLPAASTAEMPAAQPRVSGGTPDTARETRALPEKTIPIKSLRPVEFKVGERRQWDNDDAQLCAQALCLEEMFGVPVPRGAVFHADSKRRREVEFTVELRKLTEAAAAALHRMLDDSLLPAAVFKPACEHCSLFETCLPQATRADSRAEHLARQLFEI